MVISVSHSLQFLQPPLKMYLQRLSAQPRFYWHGHLSLSRTRTGSSWATRYMLGLPCFLKVLQGKSRHTRAVSVFSHICSAVQDSYLFLSKLVTVWEEGIAVTVYHMPPNSKVSQKLDVDLHCHTQALNLPSLSQILTLPLCLHTCKVETKIAATT